jgi:hypothetical protein
MAYYEVLFETGRLMGLRITMSLDYRTFPGEIVELSNATVKVLRRLN